MNETDRKRHRRRLANAVRALTMDAVQANNSGHPGTAMGMADIAEVLWNDFLRHNPADPAWANRDRFVQSNGHGSMLTYSLLHLAGYDLSLEDLRAHRKFGSKTPGHPERGMTPGVETTTGPLGQGFAAAVGMALAECRLAEEFNREGFPIVDHHTYVFAGDGCLMEGISQEAASLAGTLGLAGLVAIYDDNNISIDGEVGDWFADDTAARFRALNWNVIADVDGHDPAAIHAALEAACKSARPTLICCKTVIGFGSPIRNSADTAGGLVRRAASELGLREGIPVAHGLADTAACLLGLGQTSPGETVLQVGSGIQIMAVVDRLTPELQPFYNTFRGAGALVYKMAALQNGGTAFEWARGVLGADWPEMYARAFAPGTDNGGVLFLPYVSGERAPLLDPQASAMWSDLRLGTGRDQVIRSVFEGVALAVRDAWDALKATGVGASSMLLRVGFETHDERANRRTSSMAEAA